MQVHEAIADQLCIVGQDGAGDVVLDFLDRVYQLQLRVGNAEALVQQPLQRVQRNIGVLTHGGCHHHAAAAVEILRQVGAAAEKAYPEGGGGDDDGQDRVRRS